MKNQKKDYGVFGDTSLPIEKRLDALLSALTPEEKLKCLATQAASIERLQISGFGLGGEAAHGVEARNDQNQLGKAEETTSFPQPIGMSATWDSELIRQAGVVTGTEARVIYHRHPDRGLSRWAPTVDLERDPRWGRCEEGYGEDPLLTGVMASAYIQGMQGEHPDYLRMAATLKHFYANNTEEGRGWKSSSVDPRNRYELYLEPFRRAIEEGKAEGVMTAYNKINGIPGMLNPEVKEILKNQYGLKGHVVCDGGAMELVINLHHYYGLHAETIANAIKAGVDGMSDRPDVVERAAREAYELGLLTEAEIDEALRNTFRTKLRLGLYDNQPANPFDQVTEDDINSPAHQEICREVSREAVVLLKNENQMLPLSRETAIDSLALIGPLGDAWYQDWYGGTPPYKKTLKQGIEDCCGGEAAFEDGYDRVIFSYEGKPVCMAEDGTLRLGEAPDLFIKEDWGEGSYIFRSVRTGKYLTTKNEPAGAGRVAAISDAPFNWFVTEIFHMSQAGEYVQLTNRFHAPIQISDEGTLTAGTEGKPVHLIMEVVDSGCERAQKLAEEKDIVIMAVGCNSMINAKEEVDRKTIALPPEQEKLIEAVYQKNQNIVLVLFSNYPYSINAEQEKLPAILWSATGSQDMGTAMAETIFGINAPAGRLNLTWYKSDDQLPDIDDYDIIKGKRTYRYFDGEVLYPFGYGLTYTSFVYSDMKAIVEDMTNLKVSFSVKNKGNRASDEVAQVYAKAPASRVKKPVCQLLGFERIKNVLPGEMRKVELTIPVKELRFYDVISEKFMIEEGCYEVFAGASSQDKELSVRVDIPGEKTGLRNLGKRVRADHYDDYDNICLTEGNFGFTAVAPVDTDKVSILRYGDCKPDAGYQYMILHLLSEEDGHLEVQINGKTAAWWKGDTRGYTQEPHVHPDPIVSQQEENVGKLSHPKFVDLKLTLTETLSDAEEVVELTILLSGKMKLCYFRFE